MSDTVREHVSGGGALIRERSLSAAFGFKGW